MAASAFAHEARRVDAPTNEVEGLPQRADDCHGRCSQEETEHSGLLPANRAPVESARLLLVRAPVPGRLFVHPVLLLVDHVVLTALDLPRRSGPVQGTARRAVAERLEPMSPPRRVPLLQADLDRHVAAPGAWYTPGRVCAGVQPGGVRADGTRAEPSGSYSGRTSAGGTSGTSRHTKDAPAPRRRSSTALGM